MNGETAFQFVFICELKFKKVGRSSLPQPCDCQLLQGPLGPPSGPSSGPPGLQKSGSNVGNRNIVLPGQTKMLHMYLTPKKS